MAQIELSRRDLLRGSAMIGAGALLGGLPLSRALAATAPDPAWPAVTALLDKYVGARRVAGMVATLGWGDQAPQSVMRGREGLDDADPIGPNSLFRAYSQTKPVTGIAAMMLIEEGKLGLDQPIADFAPEFRRMSVAVDPDNSLEARPTDRLITVRHLLTHTAGFGYAGIGKNRAIAREHERLGLVPAIVSANPIPGLVTGQPVPDPDEFLRRAAAVPLCFEPGTAWRYSMSLDVLGLIIQRAAGASSFAAFLQERLFDPLGMSSTGFTVSPEAAGRLTTNYVRLGELLVPIDRPGNSIYRKPTPFAYGGAGMVTTPEDFDRFLALIVNGGVHRGRRLLRAETVALATSDLLPPGVDLTGTWVAGNGFGAGGVSGKGRDAGLYGWSGAAGTIGYANTRLKLRTGLYVQYMPQDSLPLMREFPQAVGADVAALAAAGGPAKAAQ